MAITALRDSSPAAPIAGPRALRATIAASSEGSSEVTRSGSACRPSSIGACQVRGLVCMCDVDRTRETAGRDKKGYASNPRQDFATGNGVLPFFFG